MISKKELLRQIRRKKLGVLLYDARQTLGKTLDQCADAMNVSVDEYLAFEHGQNAPSLPEIEAFAYRLDIPIDHFWGDQSLNKEGENLHPAVMEKFHQLRNRIIGITIHQKRIEANISVSDLSASTNLDEDLLARYELGQEALPLPDLELIAKALDLPIDLFYTSQGPIAMKRLLRLRMAILNEYPEETQEFMFQLVNLPYIEIARRLSKLPAGEIRQVAESLLEITL